MNEFGRFVGDLNKGMEQVVTMMNQVEQLYQSLQKFRPILGEFISLRSEEPRVETASAPARKHSRKRRIPSARRRTRAAPSRNWRPGKAKSPFL